MTYLTVKNIVHTDESVKRQITDSISANLTDLDLESSHIWIKRNLSVPWARDSLLTLRAPKYVNLMLCTQYSMSCRYKFPLVFDFNKKFTSGSIGLEEHILTTRFALRAWILICVHQGHICIRWIYVDLFKTHNFVSYFRILYILAGKLNL